MVARMPVSATASSQPAIAVPAEHEVAHGHITMLVRNLPEPRQRQIEKRINDDRVGNGEESESADRVDDRRDGDHRIRRVKVASEQEPGPGTESSAAVAPFENMVKVGRFTSSM